MDQNIITPNPHLIPGYTGHSPEQRFRCGNTFGATSHELFLDPCVSHGADLIVNPIHRIRTHSNYPTPQQLETLKRRERFVDSVYRNPIIPGYDGFVPKMSDQVGTRYLAAASAGIAQHELLMDYLRCERRHLLHQDLLESGCGRFEQTVGERLMPKTKYRAPLLPVTARANAIQMEKCGYKEKKQPYSRDTIPHFMENDDEEKYVLEGYGGHVPMTTGRYGETHKVMTHNALNDFTNNLRRSAEWCPLEMAGIGSSCPKDGNFVIYHRTTGMMPNYAGHVPGELYSYGHTYGDSTVNAKNWLALHKSKEEE